MASLPDWRAAAIIVCIPVALTLLDRRIFREATFYGDLGVNPAWPALVAFVGSGISEAVLDAVLAVALRGA